MKNKKYSGLTLVEIIAAMAILVIVLVSVSTVIITITDYNSNMRCKIKNSAIAQKVMEYYKTYDFSALSDIKSEPQYEYLCYSDDSSGGTFINKSGKSGATISAISGEIPSSTGSSSLEKYDGIVNKYFSSVPTKFDHVIKVVFTYKDNMITIDTTVFDSKSKDKFLVEYVTLKRY